MIIDDIRAAIPGFVQYENQKLDGEFHATMNRFAYYLDRETRLAEAKALLAQHGFAVSSVSEPAAAPAPVNAVAAAPVPATADTAQA